MVRIFFSFSCRVQNSKERRTTNFYDIHRFMVLSLHVLSDKEKNWIEADSELFSSVLLTKKKEKKKLVLIDKYVNVPSIYHIFSHSLPIDILINYHTRNKCTTHKKFWGFFSFDASNVWKRACFIEFRLRQSEICTQRRII